MKQRLCLLLAMLLIGTSPALAEEGGFLDSAGKFLGDTWNSVSGAASDAWDTASEAAGNALDSAGDAIGQAWTDVSGIAADAWGKAGMGFIFASREIRLTHNWHGARTDGIRSGSFIYNTHGQRTQRCPFSFVNNNRRDFT